MPRITAERPAQNRQRLILSHAAAGLVGQRHHAIDIGKIGQRIVAGERILLEDIRHHAGDMGAAVHAGEDADVVAGGDAAVRALDTVEGRRQIKVRRRRYVNAERIILGEIAHAAILRVDMLSRCDRLRGKADDLAVATDRFACCDGTDRNLVARGNALDRDDTLRHLDARHQAATCDQHAIVGMQSDHGGRGHGCLLFLTSPRSARGEANRIEDTIRVRGKALSPISALCSRREPLTPTLSPQERGEGEEHRVRDTLLYITPSRSNSSSSPRSASSHRSPSTRFRWPASPA